MAIVESFDKRKAAEYVRGIADVIESKNIFELSVSVDSKVKKLYCDFCTVQHYQKTGDNEVIIRWQEEPGTIPGDHLLSRSTDDYKSPIR